MNQRPIPVICDCCRARGVSGEDPFEAFGDLLDFEPVPRKANRADGWTADVQRAFIAALSLTGSVRQACDAVAKAPYGADQLRSAEGNEGFLAAWEQAMEISAEERRTRLSEGLSAVAEKAARRSATPSWSKAATRSGRGQQQVPRRPQSDELEAGHNALVEALLRKYWLKIVQERRARLDGRIVEADFILRQMTWFEVVMDLASGDAFEVLRGLRRGDYNVIQIAETPASRLLGELRREHWQEAGEPPRPEHPPREYLKDYDGYSGEPMECTGSRMELSHEEQRRQFEERHKRDAAAQVEWEAEARRDFERRRDAAPEPGADPNPEPPIPNPEDGAEQ